MNMALILLIIAVWLSTPVWSSIILFSLLQITKNYGLNTTINPQTLGTLGDSFGITNSLFGAVTLFFVFKGFTTQQKEISRQKDVDDSNAESLKKQLELQIEYNERNNKILQQQYFESNFTRLINYRETLQNQLINSSGNTKLFKDTTAEFTRRLLEKLQRDGSTPDEISFTFNNLAEEIFKGDALAFASYVDSTGYMMRLIESECVKNKEMYFHITRGMHNDDDASLSLGIIHVIESKDLEMAERIIDVVIDKKVNPSLNDFFKKMALKSVA